ncbi:MAG: hypothetical protein IJ213_04810 [Bacteroidales bacterium]|nr:hypothetical protein [Bacteroidales bacterium]
MENVSLFIHGSSVGETSYIPKDVPQDLANFIAKEYFSGRERRKAESKVNLCLFVEVLKTTNVGYFIYTFINNNCLAKDGRDGQYFAVTLLSKGYYFLPEQIYSLLNSAYEQLFDKQIIKDNKWTISLITSKEESYLENSIKKIKNVLSDCPFIKKDISKIKTSDFDSWQGEKVYIEYSNSEKTFNILSKVGRLYISDKYPSKEQSLKEYQNEVTSYRNKAIGLQNEIDKIKKENDLKQNKAISNLQNQLSETEKELNRVRNKNSENEKLFKFLSENLDKCKKVGINKLADPEISKASKKDLSQRTLLIIVLIFTIIGILCSYGFFRSISSSIDEIQKVETNNTEKIQDNTEKMQEIERKQEMQLKLESQKMIPTPKVDISSQGEEKKAPEVAPKKQSTPTKTTNNKGKEKTEAKKKESQKEKQEQKEAKEEGKEQ